MHQIYTSINLVKPYVILYMRLHMGETVAVYEATIQMDWYIEECTASEVDEYEEVSNGNAGDYTEYSDWEQDDIDGGGLF
ncbi:unnamed protein product [Heligmosomoides polygyrus]|uniref:Phage protein n=1 Tax=Heligmosomoides polygyrus TaxID=6339 RepID=A0A183FCV2_HELPZ|nr:unnamed protein product [Heligmosomoides polygyrus]